MEPSQSEKENAICVGDKHCRILISDQRFLSFVIFWISYNFTEKSFELNFDFIQTSGRLEAIIAI